MKRHPIALLTAFALLSAPALAADPNTLTDAEKAEGWKLLFDGKTFAGWNNWKTKKTLEAGQWVVEDGALTLTGKGGGDIYTAEAFENYEFQIEWKTTGNSGILIRVDPSVKGPIYKVAPEMQIERTKGNKSTSAGGLYDLIDIEGEKVIHPDGWNHVKIRMVDGHGTHWFNGKKIYEYQIGSEEWKKRVANSKFRNLEKFGTFKKGHICLQDHSDKVQYRSVKIRVIEEKK